MILTRIKVNNWRGKNFDFSPQKLNYVFHENGYGKTSLMDAIRYGLCGSLPNDPVKNCSVEMTEASNGLVLCRERGDGSTVCKIGGVDGKKVSEKSLNQMLVEISGVSLQNLQMISSSDIFSRMKPDDFLGLLLEYIPEQLTYETVISYIDGFTEDMNDILELYLPTAESFGISRIDECAEALTESRRILKATVKQNEQLIRTLKCGETKRSLEEIESALIDLQVRERMIADYNAKIRDYELMCEKKAKQEKQIADREEWLTKNHAEKPDPKILEDYKRERSEKDATRKKLITDQATITSAIKNLEKSIKYLASDYCPLSKKLICTTDKTQVNAELSETLRANQKFLEDATKEIRSCEERIAQLDGMIEKYYAADKNYNLYQRVVSEIKTLKSSLIVLPDKPLGEKADFSQQKKTLMEEKELAMNNIQKKNLEAFNKRALKDIEVYNKLIASLSDKGSVKTGIIDFYVSTFEEACNRVGKSKGFEISFLTDGGVKVYAKTPSNDKPVYYIGLSSGEKIVVSFLVVDMLNQLSGLRMAFIDNIEQLDRSALECLHQLITSEEFLLYYDHVFLCGVNNKDVMEVFAGDDAVKL